MQTMDNAAFRSWLAEAGIENGSRTPDAWWPRFVGGTGLSRTWPAPADRAGVPRWLAAAVQAASAEGPWWICLRDGAAWWTDREPLPYRDSPLRREVAAARVPRDFSGALGFDAAEAPALMALLEAWAAWEPGVHEDVYLVPGDRACLVRFCHDEEIHADSPSAERLQAFADAMSA